MSWHQSVIAVVSSSFQSGTYVPPVVDTFATIDLSQLGAGGIQSGAIINPQDNSLVGGHYPATVRTTWASTRKPVVARIIWDHKQDVFDTETLTFLDDDKLGTSWYSGMVDGETATWKQMVKAMLNPSATDIINTVSRTLGQELFDADGLGGDAHGRFTLEMNNYAASYGMVDTTWLAATPYLAGNVDPSHAPAQDWVRLMNMITDVPELLTLMKDQTVDFEVTGPVARTIVMTNTNPFVIGPYGAVPFTWPTHIIAKTGTQADDSKAMVFGHTFPSGNDLYYAFNEGTASIGRFNAAMTMLYNSVDANTWLMDGTEDTDAHLSDVVLLLGNSATIADQSANALPVTTTVSPTVHAFAGKPRSHNYQFLRNGGQHIEIPNHADINLAARDFTLEMVLSGDTTPNQGDERNLFSRYYPSSGQRSFQLRHADSQFQFWYSTTGNSGIKGAFVDVGWGSYTFSGGKMHVAVMRDGADLVVSVNGNVSAAYNIGTDAFFDSGGPVYIGGRGYSAPEEFGSFRLDELRLTMDVARYDFAGFVPPLMKFPLI